MHIKPRGDQILEWRFPVLLVQMFPVFCILPMIDSWAALFALQGPRAVDRLSTDPTGLTGNLELGATNVCRNGLKSLRLPRNSFLGLTLTYVRPSLCH